MQPERVGRERYGGSVWCEVELANEIVPKPPSLKQKERMRIFCRFLKFFCDIAAEHTHGTMVGR